MLRIRALNEDSNSSSNSDHEPEVTREAQETIACNEYVRALSLKRQGETEAALNLFLELLETQVLNDVTDKTKKLYSIKYNCFRNASFILEERGENERALTLAKQAIQMDDTDIYTLNKAGHLALEFNESDYAMALFQRCQEFNPNHWPSADGMLRVFCLHRNFMGAYGWAMQWHQRDDTYERAIKVLVELHEQFSAHIPMFQEMFNTRFDYDKYKHMRQETSCFGEWVYPDPNAKEVVYKDLSRFRVKELTWLTVGDWIINAYDECYGSPENLIRVHTWRDLLLKEEKTETTTNTNGNSDGAPPPPTTAELESPMDTSEGNPGPSTAARSSDESSDVRTDSDTATSNKAKKRRGSDLSFLEQWGWHKNRRHSRKRSMPAEPVEQEDMSIGTFLKQVFAKYYQVTFEAKDSPFEPEEDEDSIDDLKGSKGKRTSDCFKAPTEQETDFQKLTQLEFETFLNEFEYFDVIPLLYKWLEYTSSFWRLSLPPQIGQQYVKIYSYYYTHYGFQQWASMSCDEFKTVYAMALFFVEQSIEQVQQKTLNKSELATEEFHRLRNQLMFHSGFYCLATSDEFVIRITRYHWSNYLLARQENNLDQCLQSLTQIVLNLELQRNPSKPIKLPSKREDNVIELELTRGLIKTLERTISLNNVGRLYAEEKFKELIPILKDSLINCTTIKSADNSVMRLRTQFEILLECLWNVGDFDGCLFWGERCFQYCIDLYETIPEASFRLKDWGAAINFILTYLEALVTKHSVNLMALGRNQCRLVQNIVRLVVHQLDSPVDKGPSAEVHAVDLRTPWILLFLVRERDEVSNCPLVGVKKVVTTDGSGNENSRDESSAAADDEEEEEDHIPKSFLLLFTAHEHLGRKLWCTKDNGGLLRFTIKKVGPLLRTPMLEPFRDMITEYLEQVTYCLFAYPPKKARSRHIVEHDALQQELTWEHAIDLFDIYRPDVVPEFDAYKVDSISVDMEQLLQKIIPLIPSHLDLSAGTAAVKEFISGKVDKLPELNPPQFPHQIASIYYLIADYHFKNRDFTKPTKFYVLDLALHPWRFDSWAGLALSKATKAETKINLCNPFGAQEFLVKSEDAIRCFETCLKLRDKHTMLWIEYGSFAYMLHSFCSRNLKQASETLSMDAFEVLETYKEKFLKIAYNCFHTVDLYLLEAAQGKKGKQEKDGGGGGDEPEEEEEEESHDEKWLYHYMLGKLAEKKKDPPKVYLEHYLKASKYLYECNATYPYKINHSNPQNLSIEALEIFYRITSSILKYLEQHEVVTRDVGKLFERMLRELMTSPFTYNKAKLDNNSINALKRKMAAVEEKKSEEAATENKTTTNATPDVVEDRIEPVIVEKKFKVDQEQGTTTLVTSPSRRISQESTATSVTTTTTSRTTTTSSTSSSSSSSDSSSSDDDDEDATANLNERELELIYGICVKNLEECLVRFPEHYKSANRLVHHYLYAPQKLRNMSKARELLLSTYVTSMGSKVQGLFGDRKGNNFFNGIWRIPSSEIDRPGSFAAHLSKAVILLLEVLKASCDYEVTFDLAVQLHKSPDPDKKYIKDSECKELLQQTLSCCCQAFRNILRKHTPPTVDKTNDYELVNLMLEVHKMYRKCLKQIPGKEAGFTQVLCEVYKAYVEDKVRKFPENYNVQDLAVKFCNHEMNRRKNAEKGLPLGPIQLPGISHSLLLSSGSGTGAMGGIPNLPRSTTISVAPPQPTAMSGNASMEGVMITPAANTNSQAMMPKTSAARVSNAGAAGSSAGGGAGKPRGRPAGSKNVTAGMAATGGASAAAMKQMMGSVDPNMLSNMTALMSLYSNPAMQSDPDSMNKLIMDYYKMLLGNAAPMAGLAQALAQPSSSSGGGQQKAQATTKQQRASNSNPSGASSGKQSTAAKVQQQYSMQQSQSAGQSSQKSMPKYDMSSLIQSAASNILKDPSQQQAMLQKQQQQQLQQQQSTISLGGGQLTITPTTTPMHPQQAHANKNNKSSDAKIKSSSAYLPELPKSLTITAASGPGSSSNMQGPGSSINKQQNNNKQNPKPAVTMSKVAVTKKANDQSQSALIQQQQQQMKKYAQANQQMLQQQAMMAPGSKEYEIYMKTMAAYSEMIRSGRLPQQQQQKSSQEAKKKSTSQQATAGMSKLNEQTSASSSAYPLSAMPRFPSNLAFEQQVAEAAKQSQMQQFVGGPVTSVVPKTLQQKLADRQKANSLLESKSQQQQQLQQQMMMMQNRNSAGGVHVPPKRKTPANDTQEGGGAGQSKPRAKKAPKVDVIVLD